MVTGTLSACGLWLGEGERIMPAHPDNPDGYFENLDIVAANEALLAHFHGSWHTPPEIPPHLRPATLPEELAKSLRMTLQTLRRGAGSKPWGWKDPRTNITLPVWQLFVPRMKAVVCLRNPVAVARSLHRRDHFSLCQGLKLWQTYNHRLMNTLKPGSYIVTHYDAWFNNPEKELQRIAAFLDWNIDESTMKRALSNINIDHRRHDGATLDSLRTLGGAEPLELYSQMRALAGENFPSHNEDASIIDADVPRDPLEWMALYAKAERAIKLEQLLAEERLRNSAPIEAPVAYYRPGSTIDFRRGGNAMLYIRAGWSEAEEHFTRISGTPATIEMRPLSPTGNALRITVVMRPLLPLTTAPISLELRVSGQESHIINLVNDRSVEYQCTVPCVDKSAQVRLELTPLQTSIPDSTNSVNKQLIVIHRITIE